MLNVVEHVHILNHSCTKEALRLNAWLPHIIFSMYLICFFLFFYISVYITLFVIFSFGGAESLYVVWLYGLLFTLGGLRIVIWRYIARVNWHIVFFN